MEKIIQNDSHHSYDADLQSRNTNARNDYRIYLLGSQPKICPTRFELMNRIPSLKNNSSCSSDLSSLYKDKQSILPRLKSLISPMGIYLSSFRGLAQELGKNNCFLLIGYFRNSDFHPSKK